MTKSDCLYSDCLYVDEQLHRILVSPQFRDSPRLQTFLQFVIRLTQEGKADQLKESTIALEVFGRSNTADDSIVRSAARRLRTRLELYYSNDGKDDPITIVIPKGSYVPEIREHGGSDGVELLTPSRRDLPTEVERAREFARVSELPPTRFKERERLSPLWALAAAVAAFALCAGFAIASRGHVTTMGHAVSASQDLYLKGRYYWSRRTPNDLEKAVDYFTQAIVENPRNAYAYVGLADSYNLLSEYTSMPYGEAFKRAIAAAKTAIDLDSHLAEAHNSLAFASFYGAWDARVAESEFRRALELNPNYVTAHHWYASFLMSVGREDEALVQISLAQALEPSSKAILADKGLILVNGGQVSAGQKLLEELAAADPEFLSPHRYLASTYLIERRYADYLGEARRTALLLKDPSELAIVEAGEKGLAAGGPGGMLTNMLQAQQTSPIRTETRFYRLAQTCALLGADDKAFEYLRLAFQRRETNLLVLTIDPCFVAIHSDPRMKRLIAQVGLTA
jgi:Tfp pilus assembly protein PilF